MDTLRAMITEIQDRTGDIFNLEATPAEGTSYRLAMIDKRRYPSILCANEEDVSKGAVPYYTNSTQLPVNHTDDIFETLMLQDNLQTKYTGGTVLHLFLGEQVSDVETVKSLIRKVSDNYHLPYFTLTPPFRSVRPMAISMVSRPAAPTATVKRKCTPGWWVPATGKTVERRQAGGILPPKNLQRQP
jgi:anaerobic ribonucleoside-triphosphate reductase